MTLYPLTFEPIFKERIWGGRNLAVVYGKSLPPGKIGESWEICDRPGDESVIANGPLRGKSLHWLMEQAAEDLLGAGNRMSRRFPLLIKIIDAQETLSLQVHPPAHKAEKLGGEPKTEMWYIAQAGPKAELFVGLKKGVSRLDFEQKLASQTVAECFHRIPVKAGDAMFLPSGRVHALGAETLIIEVQQNSDTTYRVFDWNRLDDQGKSRQLHVDQSLASIDFNDMEPALLPGESIKTSFGSTRPLVANDLFVVDVVTLEPGEPVKMNTGKIEIVVVIKGTVEVQNAQNNCTLPAGHSCLFPAVGSGSTVSAHNFAMFLRASLA